MHGRRTQRSGITVILVLVFMGIFMLLLSGIAGYVFVESKVTRATYVREEAFQIAESGLEYYRWFLAHDPGDLTDGTGGAGPYVHDAKDADGGTIGNYALTISGNLSCGVLQSVDIVSKGTSADDPTFTRTVEARYAKPSVAEYAYIINDSVWAGDDRRITGPYHANGGIRMDGTNNSTVESSVASWTCTSAFGCDSSTEEPGVFGTGSGSKYWQYPVPQIDFTGIATDFPTLKSLAQAQGLYFPSVGGGDQEGYHLVFNSDNTVDVYKVTRTAYISATDITGNSKRDYDTIRNQTWLGTYSIPAGCPVIFVEDKAWIEGTIASKVTLIADDPGSYAPEILLSDDIDYTKDDGTVGLTAIAEGDIRVPYGSPYDMTVRGIFVAQTGYFGRDSYGTGDHQGTLTMTGSIVSNQRVGTKWSYESCNWWGQCTETGWSGYDTRVNAYDRALANDPPPFTPAASQDSAFVVWKEDVR
ncbi:MAG TPA: pilus assembly PilX N-terminal domain-containing protein [Candidatus Paceibacterota bacterium]|nr:pilus assembly PilX N-terminal domain-containing protein [Candidatus Paceibacterota bacterium]